MMTVTGTAPAAWASYLINGDGSGLEADEADKAERFADWLVSGQWQTGSIVSCSDDEFFCHRHDATQFGALAAMCVTYTALVEESGYAS